MKAFDFLVQNWSQLTVLIGAFGYVLKIFLDHSIKKKQIKFEYVYKEKVGAFQDFTLTYHDFKDKLIRMAFQTEDWQLDI